MKTLKRALLAFLVLFVIFVSVLFSVRNDTPLVVDLLFFRFEASAALLLVGTFALGILLGMAACSGMALSLLRARHRESRQARAFERELARVNPAQGQGHA